MSVEKSGIKATSIDPLPRCLSTSIGAVPLPRKESQDQTPFCLYQVFPKTRSACCLRGERAPILRRAWTFRPKREDSKMVPRPLAVQFQQPPTYLPLDGSRTGETRFKHLAKGIRTYRRPKGTTSRTAGVPKGFAAISTRSLIGQCNGPVLLDGGGSYPIPITRDVIS